MKTTTLIYASFSYMFKHPKLIQRLSWFVQNCWTHQNINTKSLIHSICLVLNGISSPLTCWFGAEVSGSWHAVYHLEILIQDTRWGVHTLPGWFSPRHKWTHGTGSNSQALSPSPCFPFDICFATHCITHPLGIFWILPLPSFHHNLFQLTLNDWVDGILHPEPCRLLIVPASMG